jgi:hypothetical protein
MTTHGTPEGGSFLVRWFAETALLDEGGNEATAQLLQFEAKERRLGRRSAKGRLRSVRWENHQSMRGPLVELWSLDLM